MMAEDQTSPPPSNKNPPLEEGVEGAKVESEAPKEHAMTNGCAKPPSEGNNNEVLAEDVNANQAKVEETQAPVKDAKELEEEDIENNNSADSLEEDNAEHVEEKTYTSTHSLIMNSSESKETKTISSEAESLTSTTQEVVDQKHEESETSSSVEVEAVQAKEESTVTSREEIMTSAVEESTTEGEVTETSENVTSLREREDIPDGSTGEVAPEAISNQQLLLDDTKGDGFVSVADVLPQESESVPQEGNLIDVSEDVSKSDTAQSPVPHEETESGMESEKLQEPKGDHVARGGLKRAMLTGVQKTEQPYNTCTTETKIAMEIREMREREEELRLMREQALVSPVPPKSPQSPVPPAPKEPTPSPTPPQPSPGYRVSSVFGTVKSPVPPADDEKKVSRNFGKESAVEKEIRLARDREEELRKEKGLPPREDDSYVKPSQVKSSQVRVFGKANASDSLKQAATAKIQMEIEEQTRREMALREMGHIQTISQERTDSRVAKLKVSEGKASTQANGVANGVANGNGPDANGIPKRTTPSPTGNKAPQANGTAKGGISMQKFIASRGKETTFSAPKNGAPFQSNTETRSNVPPSMVKLKRNLSVESKIQQEIMELKQREEELRMLHMNMNNGSSMNDENDMDQEEEMNLNNNNYHDYENGNGVVEEDISPRHNKLIAQWEQRIQKAES